MMGESVCDVPSHPLSSAVLRVLAYGDVFSYPLTVDEILQKLEVAATRADVLQALQSDPWLQKRVAWEPPLVALANREEWFRRRQDREQANRELWRHARHYGRYLAIIPFVRMVAVTGALAVDNAPNRDDDIDYLLVTGAGRLWLARFLVVILVRLVSWRGVHICPNYLLSIDAVDQFERSFFTAHELAQMVPLFGLDIYERLVQANAWAKSILPNAFGRHGYHQEIVPPRGLHWAKRAVEALLVGALGDTLERLERTRKIQRLSRRAKDAQAREARFSARYCKGHMDDHGSSIEHAYAERVECAKVTIVSRKVSE
jgi:hypothetical protein